jgi:hypothetical protein
LQVSGFRLILLIVLLNSCNAIAGSSLRVLFIGNSHLGVNNVPGLLAQLAAGEDRHFVFESVIHGGFTLEGHWNSGEAIEAIRRGDWDLVVLQAQSLEPVEQTASYFHFVRLFNSEIRRVGARTVLHLGWARKDLGNPLELQPRWTQATLKIAREIGAGVVPVGLAWTHSLSSFPELILYSPDGNHATLAGSYLAACAYFAALYQKSPVGKPFPTGLEAVRTALQSSAWSAFNLLEPAFWP